MKDFMAILIIAAILGAAIAYIIRAKKKGAKCIGCPLSGCCSASRAAGIEKTGECGVSGLSEGSGRSESSALSESSDTAEALGCGCGLGKQDRK